VSNVIIRPLGLRWGKDTSIHGFRLSIWMSLDAMSERLESSEGGFGVS
jgi:hypothetical protein